MDLPEIDSLWNYADPVASERAFQELVPSARFSQADYFAQLLTQIARAQILQRRYLNGHATLDQVVPLLTEETPVANVRYLLERGRAWNDTGLADDASRSFEEAFRLARKRDLDVLAVDAAHMLGVMEPWERAVAWNHRAIDLAQTSAD